MITRSYFLSVKYSHNNGTSSYSWWNGVLNTVSFFKYKPEELLKTAREISIDEISKIYPKCDSNSKIEILSINRI